MTPDHGRTGDALALRVPYDGFFRVTVWVKDVRNPALRLPVRPESPAMGPVIM